MTTTLTQTGLVPAGTQSIQMDIEENSGSFTVALNGTTINMVPWQTLPNYTVYAGNVSAWSGQTANLSITENLPSNPVVYPDWMLLDDIAFSPTSVVPDPDPLVLMGIGGALFAAYRRLMENRK